MNLEKHNYLERSNKNERIDEVYSPSCHSIDVFASRMLLFLFKIEQNDLISTNNSYLFLLIYYNYFSIH